MYSSYDCVAATCAARRFQAAASHAQIVVCRAPSMSLPTVTGNRELMDVAGRHQAQIRTRCDTLAGGGGGASLANEARVFVLGLHHRLGRIAHGQLKKMHQERRSLRTSGLMELSLARCPRSIGGCLVRKTESSSRNSPRQCGQRNSGLRASQCIWHPF